MQNNDLASIPRRLSRAPHKNTVEWEIPEKVLVTFMLIDRIGYTMLIKIKVNNKHW